MLLVGREFSEDILSRIRARVLDEPTLTRTGLSREVCGWMEWQGDDGRPKDMSCRVALLKLARRGLIELPAAQEMSFARRAEAAQAAQPSWLTIEAPLAQLGQVWLVPVDSGQAELSRTWWAMMQAHHPLGAGPLCGAQMRYLVACEAGVLGGLSFSAPAWRLAPRDEWIGWDDPARRTGLSRVVANSRYLILPSVRVAGTLWNCAGAGGDLRGWHTLSRHLLPGGQLDPSRSNAGSRSAGSHARSPGHEQGHLGLSLASTLAEYLAGWRGYSASTE